MNKKESKQIIILVWLLILATALIGVSSYFMGYDFGEQNIEKQLGEGIIVKEDGKTYIKHYENYYDVEFEKTGQKTIITINNPCIYVRKSNGLSMKPYWDNETLDIYDACYPVEYLEIGDIIIYEAEWDVGFNINHRIVDIDYKKRWVRTQGDNPETNPRPDDFVSFDNILGKSIGVLNVLEDKQIIKEEFIGFEFVMEEE